MAPRTRILFPAAVAGIAVALITVFGGLWLARALDDSVPYRIHRSEGAFFLWLWLEGLPISSAELYQRLKKRGVMVISGHYFFFGLPDDDWPHRNECLRISFTTSEHVLRRGIKILADEINQLFAQPTT